LQGRKPWSAVDFAIDMPIMHEPDARLGWRNKPGEYAFGRLEPIHVTFWSDGTRATAPRPIEGNVRFALVGDSFTEGWAVTDTRTFGWKLQERFPQVSVRNYGSAGYSTAQVLLALKELFEKPGQHPSLVVYGFSDLHEERNVAKSTWLRSLAHVAQRGHPSVPYATLANDGTLRFSPPTHYAMWPLREHSALVAVLEDGWTELTARKRGASERAVTDALLVELDRVVREHGARLIVAVLALYIPGNDSHYATVLSEHHIAAADCRRPDFLAPAMQVPYYGHPNATMNAHWAACIEAALRFSSLAQRPVP
jgi:lysophospholipase L1-like esterase